MSIDINIDDVKIVPNPTQHYKDYTAIPLSLFDNKKWKTVNLHGKGKVFVYNDILLTQHSERDPDISGVKINADKDIQLTFHIGFEGLQVTAGAITAPYAGDSKLTATNGDLRLAAVGGNSTLTNENGKVVLGSKEYSNMGVPVRDGQVLVQSAQFSIEKGCNDIDNKSSGGYAIPASLTVNTNEKPQIPDIVDVSAVKFNRFDGKPWFEMKPPPSPASSLGLEYAKLNEAADIGAMMSKLFPATGSVSNASLPFSNFNSGKIER